MVGAGAERRERSVGAPGTEGVGQLGPHPQGAPDQPELGEAGVGQGIRDGAVLQLGEQALPDSIVDRPAVVGVDQAVVPELGALVDVGNPGGGQLDQGLGQGVHPPWSHQMCHQRRQLGGEDAVVKAGVGEPHQSPLVGGVRTLPRGVGLRLPGRLDQRRMEPLPSDRPDSDQGLIEVVLVVAGGHSPSPVVVVVGGPAAHRVRPQ